MTRPAKSPGRNKRKSLALNNLNNANKKLKTGSESASATPSLEVPLFEQNAPIPAHVPPRLVSPQPALSSVNSSTSETPSTPLASKTTNQQTNVENLESIFHEQVAKVKDQAKHIQYLKNRIVELERQRNRWKEKALKKTTKQKDTVVIKPLSAFDDLLFCAKFDLSTKKRRKMKAFLRERKIHLFAKNEEVRKLELVKEIASNFDYKETTITVKKDKQKDQQKQTTDTDVKDKEKVIHSCISRDPRPLIITYLTYLDNNKKLTTLNRRIRGGISGDDGRGWTKICFIPLDVPLSSSRDNALVLAMFDAKDNYENILKFCKSLFDLINNIIFVEINGETYEMEIFAIGDMCFLCALFGHAGHSAKFPCLLCYIMKGHLDEVGRRRTWEEMMTNFASNQYSQKHVPLLRCKITNIVPSVLHIPLGIGSDSLKILEELENKINKPGSIKAVLSKYNLSRHPQTKQLNGNDMRKFLTKAPIFSDLRKIFENTPEQEIADNVIDVCSTLGLIQGTMAIKTFDERQLANLKNLTQRFKALYVESPLNFTPKGHWLVFHGPEFVENHLMWGQASEHGQEAIHGSTDDDMYKYRSLPVKKKLELVVRNCFLRNLLHDNGISFILNGTIRNPEAYNWTILSLTAQLPDGNISYCTGTVITSRHLLSSLHCIRSSSGIIYTDIKVFYKGLTVRNWLYYASPTGQDVVVLETNNEVFEHVMLISNDNLYNEVLITYAAGYGAFYFNPVTNETHFDGNLRDCLLITAPNLCQPYPNNYCANGSVYSTYFGDSGGPLMYFAKNAQFYEIAIIQSGIDQNTWLDLFIPTIDNCNFIETITNGLARCTSIPF